MSNQPMLYSPYIILGVRREALFLLHSFKNQIKWPALCREKPVKTRGSAWTLNSTKNVQISRIAPMRRNLLGWAAEQGTGAEKAKYSIRLKVGLNVERTKSMVKGIKRTPVSLTPKSIWRREIWSHATLRIYSYRLLHSCRNCHTCRYPLCSLMRHWDWVTVSSSRLTANQDLRGGHITRLYSPLLFCFSSFSCWNSVGFPSKEMVLHSILASRTALLWFLYFIVSRRPQDT